MMVDFYGVQGFLFHTDRFPVRRTAMGDDVTHPGATAVLNVPKLAASRTYRVWLVKQLQFRDESLYECKALYHHGRGHFTPSASSSSASSRHHLLCDPIGYGHTVV